MAAVWAIILPPSFLINFLLLVCLISLTTCAKSAGSGADAASNLVRSIQQPQTNDRPAKRSATNWETVRTATGDFVNITWPVKRAASLDGQIILGGLMMIHEREEKSTCGKIMRQGGIQAMEVMLYTIDYVNQHYNMTDLLPGIQLGAYILDDCDKDTYGLEMAVDFIKG
jgi:Receptor family ligand binding region